jgi:hypothetical protein
MDMFRLLDLGKPSKEGLETLGGLLFGINTQSNKSHLIVDIFKNPDFAVFDEVDVGAFLSSETLDSPIICRFSSKIVK